jgi:hypothetical protein
MQYKQLVTEQACSVFVKRTIKHIGSTESGWSLTAVSSHTAVVAPAVVSVFFSFVPLARRFDKNWKKN